MDCEETTNTKLVETLKLYEYIIHLSFIICLEAETSSHNTDEGNTMPFTNNSCKASKEHVTLEAKLHVPPDQGYQCVKVKQRFTQHCSISHSSVSGMIMGEDCMTVNFQVPTSSLPDLEKKITDSRQSLLSMKVSLVKILGKTVFETDSGKKQKVLHLINIANLILLFCSYTGY